MTSPLFDLPEAGEIFGAPFAPTGSGGHGAQERSRDETACGARLGARPLTAPSTVAFVNRFSSARQRSGEFSTGTFGEISTGIDILSPVRNPIPGLGDVMAVFGMVLERQGGVVPGGSGAKWTFQCVSSPIRPQHG